MQWALLPAELSTHPSHFRNDSCEEFRLHGQTQQEARMELGKKKSRSTALGFTWDSSEFILIQAALLGLLGLRLVLGIQLLLQG